MNKKRSNSSRNDAKTVQALEGFESPSDPVDPNIREIVERMVEMHRSPAARVEPRIGDHAASLRHARDCMKSCIDPRVCRYSDRRHETIVFSP